MSKIVNLRIKNRANMSAQDAEVRQRFANLVGIDAASDQWVCDDVKDDLYIFNCKKDGDYANYGHIRGIVYDSVNNIVASRAHRFVPTVSLPTSSIPVTNPVIHLQDDSGKYHTVNLNLSRIEMGIEGTVINAFYWNGNFYASTHRNLDPVRAHWGSSPSFRDIYDTCGGSSGTQLFDMDNKRYGRYTYHFALVHPDLVYASKIPVGEGFVVYLGYTENNVAELDQSLVDHELRVPKATVLPSKMFVPEKRLYSLPQFTLREMHNFLMDGFYRPKDEQEARFVDTMDPRLLPGEFVNITDQNGNVLKIQSRGYTWRTLMRGEDSHLRHRMYTLMDDSYGRVWKNLSLNHYEEKYPILTPHPQEFLILNAPCYVYPQNPRDHRNFGLITSNEGRYENIMRCLYLASPPHVQSQVIDFYNESLTARGKVAQWIKESRQNAEWTVGDRAKAIVSSATFFANKAVNSGQIRQEDLQSRIDANIDFSLSKENGTTLYRLYREMNREAELKDKEAQEAVQDE